MPNKQVFYLSLMICLPLALLAWLGLRLAQQQESDARRRYQDVQIERLQDFDQTIVKLLAQRERELFDVFERMSLDSNSIRAVTRRNPHVRQIFVLATDGRVTHPDPTGDLSAAERQFLTAFGDVLQSGDLRHRTGTTSQLPEFQFSETVVQNPESQQSTVPNSAGPWNLRQSAQQTAKPRTTDDNYTQSAFDPSTSNSGANPSDSAVNPYAVDHGWYTWYWGRGLNLILWNRRPTGELVGVLLERTRWMADIVAELPSTSVQPAKKRGVERTSDRVQLVDSGGKVVYQWGLFEPHANADPFAQLSLSQPLSSWRLKFFVSDERLAGAGGGVYFSVLSSLLVIGIGLVVLAVFIYREQQRHMREAAQRVNFVNQVSHELKTPLTNVRMYAELLEADLDNLDDPDTADAARSRLDVIVSESQRLSRLIGNVLTFARDQRNKMRLHPRAVCVDEVIAHVIDQFRATLAQKDISVTFQGGAVANVQVDSDALEQILVNLLSNVEKYAADGKQVTITSRQVGDVTTIVVADDGPGLAASQREKIFQPFYRGTDRIEGTTGTGIGLSIARQLARLHGGDLRLLPSPAGAKFEVQLHTLREGEIRKRDGEKEVHE